MTFKSRKTPGTSAKAYKEWLDATKTYRITRIREVQGIRVSTHFHACVKIIVNGRTMWDFAGKRRPFRTFQKAIDVCEKHALSHIRSEK
jgi:hypothetical protein